ncbi:MAG: hypothetical protein ACREQ4_05940 [Candidatus Binataceae bacterium]
MLGNAGPYRLVRYVAHCEDYTVAVVEENGVSMVGVTWNPTAEGKIGFPQTFGNQMSFILPEPLAGLVLDHERTMKAAIGEPPKKA